MNPSKLNPEIDEFLSKTNKWQEEMRVLRNIILDCGLTEELKWSLPCYTNEDKNIVIIQGFKDYCALMFFKGFLLIDSKGILVKPGENSQTQRQIRFTGVNEIIEIEAILKDYIYEAIEVEKAGMEVTSNMSAEITIPEELQNKFSENPDFKNAFNALTPGRQRAYILYFSKAKQSKTRETRIEKYMQKILSGMGLND